MHHTPKIKNKIFYLVRTMNKYLFIGCQSEFNPIEMVFSLLRKKLNKKVVKNDKEINEVIKDFIKYIKDTTLTNIFNHCKNTLKNFLKILKKNECQLKIF